MGTKWPNGGGAAQTRPGVFALVPLVAVAGAFFLSTGSTLPPAEANIAVGGAQEAPLDADLCPQNSATMGQRAVYLVDLSKPLRGKRRSLPGDFFDRLADRLDKGDELTVFAVSEYALAPRIPLGRLCKPFAATDVARATKTRLVAGESECGKLPAELPRALRETAGAFCEQRELLRRRVDDLAARQPTPATRVHLVEAIEETVAASPAGALHVFSDMFQEADWYSHSQVDWRRWEFAHFAAERKRAMPFAALPAEPTAKPATVEIFYLPRPGSTSRSEVRQRHQAFWTDYFAAYALRPTFRDQVH